MVSPRLLRTLRPLTFTVTLAWSLASLTLPAQAVPLRVEQGRLVDAQGADIVLRGFNLSQRHKLPPFRANEDPALFTRLKAVGTNAVRLQFNWEAFEPEPGRYDESYLDHYAGVVARAQAAGVYVIVDIHQDAFSRWTLNGCGEGFPKWAIPPGTPTAEPDNGAKCAGWPFQAVIFQRGTLNRAFDAFMQPGNFARERYMQVLERLATRFASSPNVIGYEPLNEPMGSTAMLVQLYRDAAARVRAIDPSAILFLDSEIWTGSGLEDTKLPNPGIANIVFAPHYYDALIYLKAWSGLRYEWLAARNRALARQWGAAVLLGEFGAPPSAIAPAYIKQVYDDLDRFGESGTQWSYTPEWNPKDLDGWNREDLSVVDDQGRWRHNFAPRPHVPRTAGPRGTWTQRDALLWFSPASIGYRWQHDPAKGQTEVFIPATHLPASGTPTWTVQPASAHCSWQASERMLRCGAPHAGEVSVNVTLTRNVGS